MDCIFSEPFLGQEALGLMNEESDIRIGHRNPLGSQLPAGVSVCANLLKSYAAVLKAYLAP